MLFSSIPFLYMFLPAVILLYFIAPRKLKNSVLLLASIFFYAWGEKLMVLLFAGEVIVCWILSLFIERSTRKASAKVFLIVSILINLGLLGYFKYTDFFISSFNGAFGTEIPLLEIALPIGISFYTFQILSYSVDVYRGTAPAQHNLIDFATYISFFPQLIAGPIVRYSDINEQLKGRTHTLEKAAIGTRRFLLGLGKKVLLANAFGEICTSFRAADPSVLYHWLYAIAFMLQIYFDFSGYSDMAIGLGKIFGFEFMENFNYPYISKSITEFWRRWHISLGSWFRDYVYIPLGGNRCGTARQLFNIFVVWMLTGLWHGSAWNFVLWGLLYAVLLTLEKLFLKKWLDRHALAGHIFVLFSVCLGFVLFNAGSFAEAGADIAGLFGFSSLPLATAEALYCLRSNAFVLVLGILCATPLFKTIASRISEKPAGKTVLGILEPLFLTLILITATAYLVDGSFNPFLYFRF